MTDNNREDHINWVDDIPLPVRAGGYYLLGKAVLPDLIHGLLVAAVLFVVFLIAMPEIFLWLLGGIGVVVVATLILISICNRGSNVTTAQRPVEEPGVIDLTDEFL